MKFVRRQRGSIGRISMLNLIDVIFVLLLFFMLTTTFNQHMHFNVKLPQASAKFDHNENISTEIYYLLDGKIFLKFADTKIEVNINSIGNFLSNLKDEYKKSIKLNADERLEYKKIIDLISVLKDSKIDNVELNIRKR